MEVSLLEYIGSIHDIKQWQDNFPDFQMDILEDAKIKVSLAKLAEYRMDAKGVCRISSFTPVQILDLNGKLNWLPMQEVLDYVSVLRSYVHFKNGKWERKAPLKMRFETDEFDLRDKQIEVKFCFTKQQEEEIIRVNGQYFILNGKIFSSDKHSWKTLPPFNQEKILEVCFNQAFDLEEEDQRFIQQIDKADNSPFPYFDKYLWSDRPDNFYEGRHVRILKKYRLYLGSLGILEWKKQTVKSPAPYIFTKSYVYFRIQKGKISKTSERVASVRFQSYNHSLNYMLSKCLVKNPKIHADIEEIIREINGLGEPPKAAMHEDANPLHVSKRSYVIVENRLDFQDFLLLNRDKFPDIRLFYKVDQFGNFWVSTSNEFEIWLRESIPQEEGTFLLRVQAKKRAPFFRQSGLLQNIEELVPSELYIKSARLKEFLATGAFEDHRESLVFQKIRALI